MVGLQGSPSTRGVIMVRLSSLGHLARRAAGSVSNREPDPADIDRARDILTTREFEMWQSMPGRDQRHSISVLARFDNERHGASRDARAAALLHDVGKTVSDLGWCMRIAATLVGPIGSRFASYHDHERIGVEMLRGASSAATIAILTGADSAAEFGLAEDHAALCRADEI